MKKQTILIVAMILNIHISFGQLTLSHVYTSDPPDTYVKLALSGLKYVSFHYVGQTFTYFKLYNPDYTLFKTINIPQISGKYVTQILFISETLFDTDTLVEFLTNYAATAGAGAAVSVCNENGVILLQHDSAQAGTSAALLDLGASGQRIFPNGIETKLIIQKYHYPSYTYDTEIYNLPGQLPCLECDNGLVSGLTVPSDMTSSEKNILAYPNPFIDNIKIKYSLPPDIKRAFITLLDISGKLIQKKEIDNHFNEVVITSEEIKQGAYIYQIVADNKIIASDKIIKL